MSEITLATPETLAGEVELSHENPYRLFADEQRRITVGVLASKSTPVNLQELAEDVSEHMGDEVGDSEVDREETALELHHVHLPKLESADVVEYDSDAHRVESVPDEIDDDIDPPEA